MPGTGYNWSGRVHEKKEKKRTRGLKLCLLLLILVLCNNLSNYKVVENPAWGQFSMPATIEELQGVVAGLSKVVKGLVGAIQFQAQSTTSHADSTSASLNSNLTTLRLPTLQLPTFRQDTKVQDDVAEFLERFQEQTSHLPATIRLSLLEQQCIGEWPRSVLSFCRGTEGFSEKSPDEQLASFIKCLRVEFQEPTDSKCPRLQPN